MAEPARRLGDADVERLVGRAEQLLARLEGIPGPGGETARAAVAALTDLYAEAFGRVVEHAREGPAVLDALTADALVGHLLALHGVHPEPVERRVDRALAVLRRELAPLGRDVTLTGLADGIADIELGGAGGGCGSPGPAELQELVRDVVVGAAPELADVRVRRQAGPAAFVPLESLLRVPTGQEVAR